MKMKTCPQCGKEFVYNPSSIYFITEGGRHGKKIPLCSYSCTLKFKEHYIKNRHARVI